MKKYLGMFVLIFSFGLVVSGCAGFEVQFEDKETGATIDTTDGKFCFSDGKRISGCVKPPAEPVE